MLKIEFQYVSQCPRVKEMGSNIKSAISQLDFEFKYSEMVIHEDENSNEGRGCPTLLVNGRDLVGKIKCDLEKPFCRTYLKGFPTIEEIKNFIQYNY